MPSKNGLVHVKFSILRNVMASATEADLGGLFEIIQKATSMKTAFAEMGNQQPPTLAATDNISAIALSK